MAKLYVVILLQSCYVSVKICVIACAAGDSVAKSQKAPGGEATKDTASEGAAAAKDAASKGATNAKDAAAEGAKLASKAGRYLLRAVLPSCLLHLRDACTVACCNQSLHSRLFSPLAECDGGCCRRLSCQKPGGT